ncbi:MAG: Asp-tRNA(Asn)/Glu-tRNA(Gln) amidotransferase subunit GatA [Acidimicrobiales bacterium]
MSARDVSRGLPLDAFTIASEVRSHERSARSVVEEVIESIERGDSEIRSFVSLMAESALKRAEVVDEIVANGCDPGRLAGVPVALKDNLCTKGAATTCSSRILEGWIPPYDATVVEKLRDAGAIVVGKTNMDEFAMGSSTETSFYGPTRNPHDTTKVPGGSSGGSAAAVAAGFVPLALGSDTGGSIRQPAALCGVVGMKPTYGRVSRYGLIAFASSLDQIGPFARSVAEAAALYEVISGHDERDSTSLLKSEQETTEEALTRGVAGLRVGVVTELLDAMAPQVVSRVREAADALGLSGADVEEVSIPELRYALSAYYLIAPAEASSNLARYDGVRYGLRVDADDVASMNAASRTAGFGPEVKRRIMLGTYALSAGYYDAYYGQAQKVRTLLIAAFDKVYERFDVLVGATSPETAFELGAKSSDPIAMYLSDVCTIPSNLAGHPAISVPFGSGEGGLPVGVQVLAPALHENEMFTVGAVIERAASDARNVGEAAT